MIKQYCIIESTDSTSRTKLVNEKIQLDWEPIGGISTHCFFDKPTFMQSMVMTRKVGTTGIYP